MKKQLTESSATYLDFRPYLHVETEIDSNTTLRFIDITPGMTTEQISGIIREHYHINLGRCIFCGNITGYTYHKSITQTVEYDTKGNVVAEINQIADTTKRNVTAFGGLFALLS